MGRNVAIGIQNYNEIIENNYFYVDKTSFMLQEWMSVVLQRKKWYDGVTFGAKRDIYNPWVILNYLDKVVVCIYTKIILKGVIPCLMTFRSLYSNLHNKK